MKLFSTIFLGLGLAGCAAIAGAACPAFPGAETIWANASLRWVLIGELHGSNEAPAVFRDLVCDALAHGKQVTVALERPTEEQEALNGILTGKDLEAAKTSLLAQPGWRNGMDGRASEAMLGLLVSLRDLRTSYPALNVAAFEAPFDKTKPASRDEAMGHALFELGRAAPRHLILVLTGNVHAMQTPQFGYDLAAMYLPAKERLSLEVTDAGGQSWANYDGACGASPGGVEIKGSSRPYGIFLDPKLAPYGKVDGVLSLGVPLTPSIPAAGDPTPLPACRSKFLANHPATP